MLLNSFFYIINEEKTDHSVETCPGASLQCTVRINPDHQIFKGHFPGYPIVPGVCVTQMAVDLFSHFQQQEFVMTKAKSIKFLNLIKPNEIDTVCYQLSWDKLENNEYQVKAVVSHEELTIAKINIIVECAN